jgi:hypothetical protein
VTLDWALKRGIRVALGGITPKQKLALTALPLLLARFKN